MNLEGTKKAASLMNNASHETTTFKVVSNGWQLCRSVFIQMQISARIAMCWSSGGDGRTRVKLVMERYNTGTARTRVSFKTDGWLPR